MLLLLSHVWRDGWGEDEMLSLLCVEGQMRWGHGEGKSVVILCGEIDGGRGWGKGKVLLLLHVHCCMWRDRWGGWGHGRVHHCVRRNRRGGWGQGKGEALLSPFVIIVISCVEGWTRWRGRVHRCPVLRNRWGEWGRGRMRWANG